MRVLKNIFVLIIVLVISSCKSSSDPSPETATYELVFTTNWSAANFSTNFPSSRHFSGLIGLTHNSKVRIFEASTLASAGIVSMAETGSKTLLISEIEDFQNLGQSGVTINGPGMPSTSTSASVSFEVSQTHSLVSVVTMIAPSPDWFTGINSIPLFVNGQWVDQIEINLTSYDAGSDSGRVFTSANAVTSPRDMVTKLTSIRTDTDFENGVHFSTLLSIGSFKLTRK